MLPYPNISPEILRVGPIAIRWYGTMYVIGYVVGYFVLKARARLGLFKVRYRDCESLVTYLMLGMIVGARLFYAFVYNWGSFREHPIEILYVWQGGLSFHGAMIGMIAACALFARSRKVPFLMVTDSLALAAAPGLFFGRMGNFINGELYGRVTDSPLAMVFPTDPQRLPRHPSQLYQGLTEGILLFAILWGVQAWAVKRGKFRDGLLGTVFLATYGTFRFFTEFTREPDAQLGFVLGNEFSMGQVLCALMWVVAAAWYVMMRRQPVTVPAKPSKEYLEG